MDKNKKEKSPWLKSKKKTGPKEKKVFDEGWRKALAETDKGSWFDICPRPARRQKALDGLNLRFVDESFPKMKRLQMIQHGLLMIEKSKSSFRKECIMSILRRGI